MARKQTAPSGPVYDNATGYGAAVPLAYPFTLAGRRVASVLLLPPAYGDLRALRQADTVTAEDILPIMSDLTVPDVEAMRWPDIEAVMLAALALLPNDLAATLSGAEAGTTAAEEPAPPVVTDDKPALSDFLVDPEEFNLNG